MKAKRNQRLHGIVRDFSIYMDLSNEKMMADLTKLKHSRSERDSIIKYGMIWGWMNDIWESLI